MSRDRPRGPLDARRPPVADHAAPGGAEAELLGAQERELDDVRARAVQELRQGAHGDGLVGHDERRVHLLHLLLQNVFPVQQMLFN